MPPKNLGREQLLALLPHRGDIMVCQNLRFAGTRNYSGMARWEPDNALLRGHFPGMPIVPGCLLIETAAQLAGAGLLAWDEETRALGQELVGVLAAVRKCHFRRPVLPRQEVVFSLQCRQMAPMAAQVVSNVTVANTEVADLDLLLAYMPRYQFAQTMTDQSSKNEKGA